MEKKYDENYKEKYYDIIGDVHGNASTLVQLLEKIGYRKDSLTGCYYHPGRKAIFVGDLIDRGTENFRTLEIVKAMVDRKYAWIVMGNHEYNALCYHLMDADGNYLRPHTSKNYIQHKSVLDEIEKRGQEEWGIYLEWFRRMPFFLEIDGIRVIHACWKQRYVDYVKNNNARDRNSGGRLTDEFLTRSVINGSEEFNAIEMLLKGEEIRLPANHPGIKDKDGNIRKKMRLKWWMPYDERQEIRTYDRAVRAGESTLEKVAGIEIPGEILEVIRAKDEGEKEENDTPVFFGHYWFSGEMKLLNEKAACLDYSVGLGGPLVCYRWNGEKTLDASGFVSVFSDYLKR
jgi:hypothetical protein